MLGVVCPWGDGAKLTTFFSSLDCWFCFWDCEAQKLFTFILCRKRKSCFPFVLPLCCITFVEDRSRIGNLSKFIAHAFCPIFVSLDKNKWLMLWLQVLSGILFAFYLVLVLSATAVVVLENRQPAKTMAWILVLTFVPVVGLVLFWFFGRSLRHEKFISKRNYLFLTRRLLSYLHPVSEDRKPEAFAPLINFFEWKNRALLTEGNRVSVITRGGDFLDRLLADVVRAKSFIHIESYIIENDAVGRRVSEALCAKAEEGVEVRLLYDDVGCWQVKDAFFHRMRKLGVKVEAFLPVRFPSLTHKVNYRNHRKISVIDGRVGYIGGMNLADRYVSDRWTDMHLRLTGPAVGALQRLFLGDWQFVTGKLVRDARLYPPLPQRVRGGAMMQIVNGSPVMRYPEIMYGLTWVIQNARRYVYIQTPYFMPTEPVIQALQTAAMSGVEVRVMLPERPDGFWLRFANDSYVADLLKAGIRVFFFADGFLHSKVVVSDDQFCSIGSSNVDFRSFENNFEANAFIYDATTAMQVKRVFLENQGHCRELYFNQWKKRSRLKRFLESNTRILSPLF